MTMTQKLPTATQLNLINRIEPSRGSAVPIGWAKHFRAVAPAACLHAGCHLGHCVYRFAR